MREVIGEKRTHIDRKEGRVCKFLNSERAILLKELERSNRELRELVFVTSHHLHEPTRKIFTYGNMLFNSLRDKIDTDDRENLQFIIDGARKMQALVDDLLLYSEVILRKERARVPVDLNEIVEKLRTKELASLLDATHGIIKVPEPLLPVQADPVQVRLLMQNLIANGLKFHRVGTIPEVTIRSSRCGDKEVRVSVEDNGVGISREYHNRIFSLFHQLQPSEDGTGVGLAICKKVVEQHGGAIGVESTPGRGSTFWFTLPIASRNCTIPVTVSKEIHIEEVKKK